MSKTKLLSTPRTPNPTETELLIVDDVVIETSIETSTTFDYNAAMQGAEEQSLALEEELCDLTEDREALEERLSEIKQRQIAVRANIKKIGNQGEIGQND